MTATDEAARPVQPAPPARGRTWRRRLIRVVRVLVLVYVGCLVVLYALQNSLIFPGRSTQGQRSSVVPPGRNYELVELKTKTGDRVVAAFGAALAPDGAPLPDASSRPTMLFFYGNGMCLADCMGLFDDFRRCGANVMIPDYAGYGMSGGAPSEASFYATADACWAHLNSRGDVDKRRLVPAGWSIGAGVAIDLAARERSSAALVTLSAFTSMNDMARGLLPWLPTSLLLKHRFENERKIRTVDVPTLIIHGRGDRIIPFDMSVRLSRAAGGRVTTLWLETDHNDLFDLGSDEILPALRAFLESVQPRR
jgi:fermentation-respiration switch protein FrsA (DUF1100 family)